MERHDILKSGVKGAPSTSCTKNISDKEKSHLNTLIGTFNHRVQQLLLDREKVIREEDAVKGPGYVDYEMLNVASNRALNYRKGWDDLNVVNATMLGIQLEK